MNPLNEEQLEHFSEHGYVLIRQGFPKEVAAEWASDCYRRLGIDPNDQASWRDERVHMPGDRYVDVAEFAPKVYDAI